MFYLVGGFFLWPEKNSMGSVSPFFSVFLGVSLGWCSFFSRFGSYFVNDSSTTSKWNIGVSGLLACISLFQYTAN